MKLKEIIQKAGVQVQPIQTNWGQTLIGLGKFITWSTFILLFIGFAIAKAPNSPIGGITLTGAVILSLLSMSGAAILGMLGSYLLRRGRQMRQLSRTWVDLEDSRPPILYLRSFKDDAKPRHFIWPSFFGFLNPVMSDLATEEEDLSRALTPVAPVIAIGNPSENKPSGGMPTLGASRFYVSHEHWQEAVFTLMQHSRFVILRGGATDGLWWEINTVLKNYPIEQTAFYLKLLRKDYDAFKQRLEREPGLKIHQSHQIARSGMVMGFLYFGPDRAARFAPLRAPFFRTPIFRSATAPFCFALQPLYEKVGLGWQRPSIAWGKILLLTPLALFVLLFLLLSIEHC